MWLSFKMPGHALHSHLRNARHCPISYYQDKHQDAAMLILMNEFNVNISKEMD